MEILGGSVGGCGMTKDAISYAYAMGASIRGGVFGDSAG